MQIGIIDHSSGNIGSLKSAIEFYKYPVKVIEDGSDLDKVEIVFLSGVGTYDDAVSQLKKRDLWSPLNEYVVKEQKPIVGICLGMQLFSTSSEEGTKSKGFGWIPGSVERMKSDLVKVPHIGWNYVSHQDTDLFSNVKTDTFYFMHSYQFKPDDVSVICGLTPYGNNEIASAIIKENIVGFQFHPEKSQGDGMRVIRNVIEGFSC